MKNLHCKLNFLADVYIYIYTNWITMTRKSGKHFHVTYGTLEICFDLIRSHQQCIPWPPPQEIEPATTECRVQTLPQGHWSISSAMMVLLFYFILVLKRMEGPDTVIKWLWINKWLSIFYCCAFLHLSTFSKNLNIIYIYIYIYTLFTLGLRVYVIWRDEYHILSRN